MSPITKELLIDFKELKNISVTCSTCQTEVVMDAGNPRGFVPTVCPSCKTEFDTVGLQSPLDSYRSIYRQLAASKHPIRIRLVSKEEL